MSELSPLYSRFLDVLQNDIDTLLKEQDPLKRNAKGIAELLKIASAAEEELKKADTSEEQLAKLSPEAKRQIDEIIKRDLGII